MRCHEIRSLLQERGWSKAGVSESQEITEHITSCASCAQFVNSQRHVWTGLQMLRQSSPLFPASLDSAVLSSYRKAMAERGRRDTLATFAPKVRWRLGFGGALAALLLVAMLILVLRRHPTRAMVDPALKPATAMPHALKPPDPAPAHKEIAAVMKARKKRAKIAPQDASLMSLVPAASEVSVPEGFKSLIYCDELICDGEMELVRVQLSSSSADWTPDARAYRRVVSAEVLVGADGFARGIRITP